MKIKKMGLSFLTMLFAFLTLAAVAEPARLTDSEQREVDDKKIQLEEAEKNIAEAASVAKQTRIELMGLEEKYNLNERPDSNAELLQELDDKGEIELFDRRAYPTDQPYPRELKCTTEDVRIIHNCIQLRFFDPSTRVYFDTGSDDDDEVDLFNDGNLNITIDLVSLYWPWRLGHGEYFDKFSWGPVVGVGIGAPGKDSNDPDSDVSGAPVVLISGGGMLEYRLESGPAFAFEAGISQGYTTDESFGDIDDSAVYVGLRINIPIGGKPEPITNR